MKHTDDFVESASEFIAKVIHNRGRNVDLHEYLRRHPDDLLKGVIVPGSIGSGKTQRAMRVVRAALDAGFGVLVFDSAVDS